jgi:MFS family permease
MDDSESQTSHDDAPKDVNMMFMFGLVFNVYIGCMQAGFVLVSNNYVGQILE